jgi:hypothetical protein
MQSTKFELAINLKTGKGARAYHPAIGVGVGGPGNRIVDRRHFICSFGCCLVGGSPRRRAEQAAKMCRILQPEPAIRFTDTFRQGLREHGYVEGQNNRVGLFQAEFRQNHLEKQSGNLPVASIIRMKAVQVED